MEAGTETEAMEGGCLLAFCPWLFILLPCTSKDHQPRGDITHSALDLLMSINNQEKAPPRTSLEAGVVDILSIESPSLQKTLVCVKLSKNEKKN